MKNFLLLLLILFPAYAFATPVGPLVNAPTLTVTTGGVWQSLFTANGNRSTLWIENPCTATSQGISTAESLFVYFIPSGGACLASGTAGAFELTSCGSIEMDDTYRSQQAICVYAATTNHAFTAAQTQ